MIMMMLECNRVLQFEVTLLRFAGLFKGSLIFLQDPLCYILGAGWDLDEVASSICFGGRLRQP